MLSGLVWRQFLFPFHKLLGAESVLWWVLVGRCVVCHKAGFRGGGLLQVRYPRGRS